MNEVVQFLVRHGYTVVFVWVLAEQAGIPLPAVPLLLAGGALAAAGMLNPWILLLMALLGSLISDSVWYYVGRRSGTRVLARLCKLSLEPDSCVRTTEAMFSSHGVRSILVAKFLPGFSTVAPPVAGAFRMPYARFLAFDMLGTLLWAGLFLLLGYIFGQQLEQVANTVTQLGTWLFWAVVVSAALYILVKYVKRRMFLRDLRISRISPEEVERRRQQGDTLTIVDLRHASDFANNPFTIPGALRLSPEELEARHLEIPRGHDIILFCTWPNEATSARVALRLKNRGITRVRPLAGGLDRWRELDYPIEARLTQISAG